MSVQPDYCFHSALSLRVSWLQVEVPTQLLYLSLEFHWDESYKLTPLCSVIAEERLNAQ